MTDRFGSITVSALVGTGAATLGLALFGLAGIGSDLRAADSVRTTPVVTQELDLRKEQSSPKWDGQSAAPQRGADQAPQSTPASQPQKEL